MITVSNILLIKVLLFATCSGINQTVFKSKKSLSIRTPEVATVNDQSLGITQFNSTSYFQNISTTQSCSKYQMIIFKAKKLRNSTLFRAKGETNASVNLEKINTIPKTRCKVWLMKKSNFKANKLTEPVLWTHIDPAEVDDNEGSFEIYMTVSNENNAPSVLFSINDFLNLLIAACSKKALKRVISLMLLSVISTTIISADLGQKFVLKTTKLVNRDNNYDN